MKALAFFIFIAIFSLALATAVAPEPYCKTRPLYKQFPLVMEEILTHDMSDSFAGYNLEISLPSNLNFATISKKITELDRLNTNLTHIVSHYI